MTMSALHERLEVTVPAEFECLALGNLLLSGSNSGDNRVLALVGDPSVDPGSGTD
jgi:hypothetical protein